MKRPLLTSVIIGLSLGIYSCDYVQGSKIDEADLDPGGIPKGPGIFTGRSGEWSVINKR